MQKLRYGVFLLLLTGLLMFLFLERYTPIRMKFQRPQPHSYSLLPSYSPEEMPFYQLNTTTSFSLVNTFKNIHIWQGAKPLLIVDELLFVAGYIQDESNDDFYDQNRSTIDLFAVDINTGDIRWQAVVGDNNLAADAKRIYVLTVREPFDAAHIAALDLQSGEPLWDTGLDFSYAIGVSYLATTDSDVIAVTYNRGNDAQYRLNSETGEIKERRQSDFVETRPQHASLIFTIEGFSRFGSLVALYEADEAVAWRYEPTVVSNIVVEGSVIYFVTKDVKLVVLDSMTGVQLGQLQFTPVFPADFDFSNNDIIVAAADDIVAVYFADQQQLSLFRFILHPS